MRTVDDIIDALGGTTTLARELGMRFPARVSDWRRRRSIPMDYWDQIVGVAHSKGIHGITPDVIRSVRRRTPS